MVSKYDFIEVYLLIKDLVDGRHARVSVSLGGLNAFYVYPFIMAAAG